MNHWAEGVVSALTLLSLSSDVAWVSLPLLESIRSVLMHLTTASLILPRYPGGNGSLLFSAAAAASYQLPLFAFLPTPREMSGERASRNVLTNLCL